MIVALVLIVLLGFAAIVIDLGYARTVQGQLQAAADAAALSAAPRLDQSAGGLLNARQTAVNIGAANTENGHPVVLDPNPGNFPTGDVVLGVWNPTTRTFTPSVNATQVNAVQVTTRDLGLVPLFSKVSFGNDELGAAARSVGVVHWMGAGRVNWYLPFGLPLCLFQTLPRDALNDQEFTLNPAGMDNTGWVRVLGNPSASWIRSELQAILPCMEEYTSTGGTTTECSPASVGDSAGLGNGADQSALKALANEMTTDGVSWDAARWGALPSQHATSDLSPGQYGHVIFGPIPIVDVGSTYCTPGGGSWNQTAPVAGFAMAVIYDVAYKGSVSTRNVWIRIDVDSAYHLGSWYGGTDYGVVASGPGELVQ